MLTAPPPPATDHAAVAEAISERINAEARVATYGDAMAYAQVHATLAVAHEAHTANLIAVLEHLPPHSAARDQLVDEVRARLLPEDVTP